MNKIVYRSFLDELDKLGWWWGEPQITLTQRELNKLIRQAVKKAKVPRGIKLRYLLGGGLLGALGLAGYGVYKGMQRRKQIAQQYGL